MSTVKAEVWEKKEKFSTSQKCEKALVTAARNVFNKIGGGAHVVKDRTKSNRHHVDMLIGHHALFASILRNESEVVFVRRKRRRAGTGNSVYLHRVDDFAASIKHLSRNHADKKVFAGYYNTDTIDPDMVVATGGGRWAFAAAEEEPKNLSASMSVSTLLTAA
eukprot:TRINITY_DN718_c0_g1_i3.p3 TRINITY_DN718_c0_g1~~TRINITY_DN718_c0_g1_i3.p3  ORF type:complete len:163 (-),score=58.44 TRINITY_DN718_c0_g1_i3:620-1108(-)